jgi:DNA-binding MarR family transcriptional regulator
MEAHSDLVLFVDAVARMRGRLRTAFNSDPDSRGLASMEPMVLAAVVEATNPPTVPQIGRSLGHSRQAIQRAANDLIAAGLIEAVSNPDHKRAGLLLPTPLGREVQAQANRRAEVIAAELLGAIDPAIVREATKLLNMIRAALEQHQREAMR